MQGSSMILSSAEEYFFLSNFLGSEGSYIYRVSKPSRCLYESFSL